YLVTQEEWEKVMGNNPSQCARTGASKDLVANIPEAELKRFPVENVSWDQAQEFLKRLNERHQKAGWVYRLPREVEWEYACRGGPMRDRSESAFDFYLDRPANVLMPNQANVYRLLGRSRKVGGYPPNKLGLFDMHGNVIQWCDAPGLGDSVRVSRGDS